MALSKENDEEKAAQEETLSPAIAALNSEFSKDRFAAANALQKGTFGKEALTQDVVKNVSRQLMWEDPTGALTWAGNWNDANLREAAIGSVIWSWVRSDPNQCTAAVNRLTDPKARDVAAAGVINYLVEHRSFDEASAWVASLSDPVKRAKAEESLPKVKR